MVTSNEYPTSQKKVKLSSNLTSHPKEVEERQSPKLVEGRQLQRGNQGNRN